MEKQNRTRNLQMLFRVTLQEKELIREKMRLLHMDNMQAYMRQMAIKGYMVAADYSEKMRPITRSSLSRRSKAKPLPRWLMSS